MTYNAFKKNLLLQIISYLTISLLILFSSELQSQCGTRLKHNLPVTQTDAIELLNPKETNSVQPPDADFDGNVSPNDNYPRTNSGNNKTLKPLSTGSGRDDPPDT